MPHQHLAAIHQLGDRVTHNSRVLEGIGGTVMRIEEPTETWVHWDTGWETLHFQDELKMFDQVVAIPHEDVENDIEAIQGILFPVPVDKEGAQRELHTRHQNMVARVQEKLFKHHTPKDYCIHSETLRIRPPTLPHYVGPEQDLGALTYDVQPYEDGERIEITIGHAGGMRFDVSLSIFRGTQLPFGWSVVSCEFRALDKTVLACIQSYRRDKTAT